MDEAITQSSATAEEDSEVLCLMRVGQSSGWLRLFENTEVSIGRGVDVTYQLVSSSCPLMISRLHCTFRQREDGQWTVTDKKSMNGVWVNGSRLAVDKPHLVKLGDSIQLGVPVSGSLVEHDYVLIQRPLKDVTPVLEKPYKDLTRITHLFKKPKRKMTDEPEPSTSSKPKLYRSSGMDKSSAQACPLPPVKPGQMLSGTDAEVKVDDAAGDMDNLQMYSQNILMLREQVDSTERQVASLEGQPSQSAPYREEQVKELQGQLDTLRAKMGKMKTLEKSFNEAKKQLEEQKTQHQEEHLKKQLEDALHEQKKVIDELALSRKGFEEKLLAKNKELEETKEEKEKAREEVVTQVTEVLENELQCSICSELFIEAVILNCAHGFCFHCIQLWRKKKNECPICRQAIQSQTRCLALDNCIDRMVENLSLEMKTRRQQLVNERKGVVAPPAEVLLVPDEDSSVSSEPLLDEEEDSVLVISSPSSSQETLDSEEQNLGTDDDCILGV